MDLFQASRQWAVRPDDERFESLEDLLKATKDYAEHAAQKKVPYKALKAVAKQDDVMIVGPKGQPAVLSHWAFGQLARRVGAPAEYLRDLPADLAARNLNHGLQGLSGEGSEDERVANILFHQNGNLVARAITSDRYTRIWNFEVAQRLLDNTEHGWQVPPARPCRAGQKGTRLATQQDVLRLSSSGLSIKVGESIAPAGLYASDHDLFCFLVNEDARIDDGTPEGMGRGVFVINSEVGAAALKIIRFLYRYVCGNHIVWGAESVKELSVRHIGNYARQNASHMFYTEMKEYAEESASDEQAMIKKARQTVIASTKEKVLDVIFGKRLMSRKTAEMAYAAVVPEQDGDPNLVWGFVQGVTRSSQATPYADERSKLDVAAGKILEASF